MRFENLGLEEIPEIVDLVKRFPMSIWLQNRPRYRRRERASSSLKIADFADHSLDHMPSLLYVVLCAKSFTASSVANDLTAEQSTLPARLKAAMKNLRGTRSIDMH